MRNGKDREHRDHRDHREHREHRERERNEHGWSNSNEALGADGGMRNVTALKCGADMSGLDVRWCLHYII